MVERWRDAITFATHISTRHATHQNRAHPWQENHEWSYQLRDGLATAPGTVMIPLAPQVKAGT